MNWKKYGLFYIIGIGVLLYIFRNPIQQGIENLMTPFETRIAPFIGTINQMASTYGLPPELIKAVIKTESNGQWDTLSDNDQSAGLMMIWLPTAQQYGFTGTIEDLKTPVNNLFYGCAVLSDCYKKYSAQGIDYVYAAYNDGVARKNDAGQFVNSKGSTNVQDHVDNFMSNYNSILAEAGTGSTENV